MASSRYEYQWVKCMMNGDAVAGWLNAQGRLGWQVVPGIERIGKSLLMERRVVDDE